VSNQLIQCLMCVRGGNEILRNIDRIVIG
jgi:hypothetical protein